MYQNYIWYFLYGSNDAMYMYKCYRFNSSDNAPLTLSYASEGLLALAVFEIV